MKTTLAIAAAIGLTALPAVAADVIQPAPIMPILTSPVSAHDWTGFYIGLTGAYANVSSNSGAPSENIFGVGVHAGYMLDMGDMVAGVRAEYSPSSLSNLSVGGVTLGDVGRLTGQFGLKLGDGGSTLAYAMGGLGVARSTNAGTDYTDLGWTVGAGVTQALSDSFSLTGEVSYIHFDNVSGTTVDVDGVGVVIGLSYHF
ncbi:outer membrane protein [Pelagibacterium lacus]|uniref:Porin family protein n=1 Tax=Pelagibacterium lacus TaxID=2282655 RepID=A0A369VZD3_9HYPH|nr:outer membrane beta-barrel protein [Pelagibacterium lacus]RDE07668.1 porin family protein [Pelagibacterium lacus]